MQGLVRIAFVLIVAVLPAFLQAQSPYYPFFPPDSASRARLSVSCSNDVLNSFIVPSKVTSDYKKTFKEQRDDMTEYVQSLIKNTATFDTLINPFLQHVAGRIATANPQLRKYTIILSDWPIMNAFYVGGNTVIVCMPLLSRMASEDEVAAVLCHELAHGELDHVQQGLKKRLDAYYNKAFQKELKKALKEEFNVEEKVNMLALKFTLGSRYHDRALEKAADSLGYIMFSKTRYDNSAFVSTLETLKHIDEPAYADTIDYAGLFRCGSSGFDFSAFSHYHKSSIFEREKQNKELVDSLRTHPGCDQRIAYIREMTESMHPAKGDPADSKKYDAIRYAAAMETIMAFYNYEYYDYSLFNTLVYIQHDKNNEFLAAMVTLNWQKLYSAMKIHELSDFLSNYALENPGLMDDFLYLVNSLRLSDIRDFNNCFVNKHPEIKQKEFLMARDYCTSNINEDAGASKFQEQYMKQFHPSRFQALMKPETNSRKKKH